MGYIDDYLLNLQNRTQSRGMNPSVSTGEPSRTNQAITSSTLPSNVNAIGSYQSLQEKQDPKLDIISGQQEQARRSNSMQQAYVAPPHVQQADPNMGLTIPITNVVGSALKSQAQGLPTDVQNSAMEGFNKDIENAIANNDEAAYNEAVSKIEALQGSFDKQNMFGMAGEGVGAAANIMSIGQQGANFSNVAGLVGNTAGLVNYGTNLAGMQNAVTGTGSYLGTVAPALGAVTGLYGVEQAIEKGNYGGAAVQGLKTGIGIGTGLESASLVGGQAGTGMVSTALGTGVSSALSMASGIGAGIAGAHIGGSLMANQQAQFNEENFGKGSGKFLEATGQMAQKAEMGFGTQLNDQILKRTNTDLNHIERIGVDLQEFSMNPAGKIVEWASDFFGGTVVCTQLHAQKRISKEVYKADGRFGKMMDESEYLWYLSWGTKIAQRMAFSQLYSSIIAFFFVPISKYMAWEMGVGKGSTFGKLCFKTLQLLHKVVGRK